MASRSKSSQAVVIAVTSDQHCGSTVALAPNAISLDDGGEYLASRPQQWLWQSWLAFWQRAAEIRAAKDARLFTVFNGDMTDGDHHGTTQILSGNPTAQAAVVDAVMRPVLDLKPDVLAFVRGTEAHVGKSAAFEERIAKGLKKDKWNVIGDPVTGTASHWQLELNVQGILMSFVHHGRMGQRPWTRINVVANLAAEVFYERSARGQAIPHLAVRSHMHRFADTFSAHPVRLIQTPAWQLHTAFTHKVVPESLADIGGVIIVIERGAFTVEPVLFKPTATPVIVA